MLHNYLRIAWRSLWKSPLFTLLNGLGMALGLTVSLLLLLHVRDEWSFDRFHGKAGRIHRVIQQPAADGEGPVRDRANCPNSVAPVMRDNIAAVEQSARLLLHNFGESAFVQAAGQRFVEKRLYWADPALPDIFDLQVLAGDFRAALRQPNAVLLSRSAAQRFFGTTAVLGQTIVVDRMPPLEVKGVYEDFPANSTLDADLIGSFASVRWAAERLTWDNASFETWLLLRPDADARAVESQMAAVLANQVPPGERRFSLRLQALPDVHLGSGALQKNYSARLGDPRQVNILAGLALAVLLIACFNYMNLATARSQARFREVGINKTLGAGRRQLALRFFVETGVMVGLSMLVAVVFLRLALPFFNDLADKNLEFAAIFRPGVLFSLLGVGAVVTLVAGAYPAFFLSSFLPKNLLQTAFQKDGWAGLFRRSLVVTQFALATVLLLGASVLYRQLLFIQEKNLGYEPTQVIAITAATARDNAQRQALLDQVKSIGVVQAAAFAQTFPGRRGSGRTLARDENDEQGLALTTCLAWPDLEKVLDLRLLAGRMPALKAADDTTTQVTINRTAAAYLGFSPEQALGQRVVCQLGPAAFVVGVVEDFHAESLHQPIGAYAFHNRPSENANFLLAKLNTQNLPETMRQLEQICQRALPDAAFEYTFLDDHLDRLYRADQRTARVVLIFSVLAMLIACLGLFGLAAFTAEQRTKEIGIRKVLGASVAGITGLLAVDFLKLVLIAIVVASPLAWYALNRWLEDFAYHVEIAWWMFALAGLLALLIAFLTVSFQSVKAALANPARVLKSE